MEDINFIKLAIYLGILLFSCSFHESAHAYAAMQLGDHTARQLGRISLNPLRHIDPFNTIILPILLLIATKGQFVFGGAKPTPINPLRFRNPELGMAVSAGAGPISNFILAGISLGVFVLCYLISPSSVPAKSYNAFALGAMMWTNILLGVFNLIPIPPLDGSRLLRMALPEPMKPMLDSLEMFGLVIVALILYSGAFSPIFEYFFRGWHGLLLAITGDPRYTVDFLVNVFRL